ncbi:MAG: DUF2892 domain-containing protein [Planctomycetota bacterium]
MSTTTSPVRGATAQSIGSLKIVPFLHPQGCRTYLIGDPDSGQSLALDVHLDLVKDVADRVRAEGWSLPYVVDTHTHADHPSGAGDLAPQFGSTRIAHKAAHHRGVARHPDDGDRLHLGDQVVTIRHAPGHTPDHLVLLTDGALFSGDTLFIGGVARTDFLGGDAGQLHDTIHALIADLPDETVVYPGHDYEGRTSTSLGNERAHNPWLRLSDRSAFVKALTANPPPRPANMDDLLRLNREGVNIPDRIDAATVAERVRQGGATSVVDVRMGAEYESEHIPGSRLIPLDQIEQRLDEVMAVPAPRLLLCRTGNRAFMARDTLVRHNVAGLSVVEGGIEAYRRVGGDVKTGVQRMSLERQVRIGAGLLVILGALLAWLVHPLFIAFAAMIGAGLVFAGVTDRCGMALVLAKAPWNRARGDEAAGTAGGCAASLPAAGGCAASAPTAGGCAATHVPPPLDSDA